MSTVKEQLERDEKLAIWAFSVLSAWLVGLSLVIGDIRSDLKAIRQSAKDHGQEIVSQLEHPKSQVATDIALLDVTTDAKRATIEKRSINPSKLSPIVAAVTNLTRSNPSSNETWAAASALISYQSLSRASFQTADSKPCFEIPVGAYVPHPKVGATLTHDVILEHCTLVIDDISAFQNSLYGKTYEKEVAEGSSKYLRLLLSNVQLVYRGGVPIAFSQIFCHDCTFTVNVSEPPAAGDGRSLIRQLLASQSNTVQILPNES